MAGGSSAGVDNTSRRKFRDEYAKRKLEELQARVNQQNLQSQNEDEGQQKRHAPVVIDFKSQVGKTTLCASPDVGFTCEVCNCTKKDHLSLLDHLNSPEHLKALGGGGAEVKKVTAADVRNKLSKHKAPVAEDPAPSKKKKSKKSKEP